MSMHNWMETIKLLLTVIQQPRFIFHSARTLVNIPTEMMQVSA
jgi:hypothetical protein